VVGANANGSETGETALAVASGLGGVLGTALHVVSAYGVFRASTDDAILEAATQSASAQRLQAVTHARGDDPAEALIAVAEEQDADLVVVGDTGMSGRSRFSRQRAGEDVPPRALQRPDRAHWLATSLHPGAGRTRSRPRRRARQHRMALLVAM
jgi:hypothetical protein